jgi:hypothetical protein
MCETSRAVHILASTVMYNCKKSSCVRRKYFYTRLHGRCKICDFHGCDFEECDTVLQLLVTVNAQLSVMILSTLMMEAIHNTEISIIERPTRRHIPENGILRDCGCLRTWCWGEYLDQGRGERTISIEELRKSCSLPSRVIIIRSMKVKETRHIVWLVRKEMRAVNWGVNWGVNWQRASVTSYS